MKRSSIPVSMHAHKWINHIYNNRISNFLIIRRQEASALKKYKSTKSVTSNAGSSVY